MIFKSKILDGIVLEARDLARFRWVIHASVNSTLKLRYKKSFFGFFWSLLGPILNYGTLSLVFYFGLKVKSENFLAHILPGILLFSLFNTAIIASSSALIANENFIKKIYLPKSIFIVNSILVESINFVFNFFSVMFVLLLLGAVQITPAFVILPLIVLLFIIFIIGLALLCAVSGVFFRDVMHIIPLTLQALFYATPILYDPSILPPSFHVIFRINPILPYIDAFRLIIEKGAWPTLESLGVCFGLALLSFLIGIIVLKQFENKIVFKL